MLCTVSSCVAIACTSKPPHAPALFPAPASSTCLCLLHPDLCPAAACAAAGDAEAAFKLFGEMRADGVAPDRMVYASVIKACAEQIDRLPASERCVRVCMCARGAN